MAKSEPKYLKTTEVEVRSYLEAQCKLTTSTCYGRGRSSIEVRKSSGFDYNHGDICGLVFYHPGRVDIGLTKINNDNLIPDMRFRSVYPPKDITGEARDDFFYGRGYAVVQGKLFAIGGGSIYGYISDKPETEVVDGLLFYKTMNSRYPLVAHVCDLQKIFSSSDDEHLEFELAVYMKGPKEFPLVVPYKKKIFVLSNPGKHDQFLTPTPFEVLSLSNDGVTVEVEADPPFWKQDQFISMEAHAVAESRLYICVLSKNISFTYTLYCFDMDNSQWVQQEMLSFPGRSFEKTVEKLEQKKIAPYHILASFLKVERSFICYHSGKSFQFDCDDPSNPSLLVIYDKKSGKGVPVKDVVESMKLEGRARDGWVLGVDENKSDVYFLIVWVEKPLNDNEFDTVNYIRGCKFKLLDDYGSCEILTSGDSWGYEFGTVPEFGPVPDCADHLCLAFTRSNSRDPKADYYQCYMAHKMYSKEW